MEKSVAKSITDIVGSLYIFEAIMILAGFYLLLTYTQPIIQIASFGTIFFGMILFYRQKSANNEVFKK